MSRIVDLTLSIASVMHGVAFKPVQVLVEDGWNATTLHLYSHSGTHMDAPIHFGVGCGTIDKIPLDKCMGPAWVVNLPGIEPRTIIEVKHLGETADKLEAGDSLLIRTGWSAYVNLLKYCDELPRISLELAQWCVTNQVKMLGVEPPSIADVNNIDELTAVHKVLFEGGVIVVEGLTNIEELTQQKATFAAFPLKVDRGDGAPVRTVAIEDDD
jgi:kynurenine formamidase